MLGFLRKHQKYFFVMITIVIVISFSFFGTYGTLGGNNIHEQVAFTTIDGTNISRGQLEEFAQFISTDQDDSKMYGGSLGPNFLNDGVIKQDFLETGLAAILIQEFEPDFKNDLMSKHSREAHFKPYTHPDAPFVSSKTVWNYFAPDIIQNLSSVQRETNPSSKEAIKAKIALYLAEKKLPSPYLKQILLHQEKQYSWLPHDENLEYLDLSLFGYHTPDDWFGPKFTRLIAQFIMNSAQIAEQKGYKVSKEEALADLIRNARISFKENQSSPNMAAANPNDYLQQQLMRMRLDRTQAVNIWQQVLLFRRLFQDVGNAVLVDRNTYDAFNEFANETTVGSLYRLPEDLRLGDFESLPQFETYLNSIAKRSREDQAKLTLPSKFFSPEEIAKKTPELVHKRYLIDVAKTSQKAIEAKVTVRDTLEYEISDANWETLQKQFPELGIKVAKTAEERLDALDSLDQMARSRVDHFARKAIAKAHPEWINDALTGQQLKKEAVSIRLRGESPAFMGLKNGEELIKLLDAAPVGEASPSLSKITFDNENFYRIIVLDRSEGLEVLTYREAKESGVLDQLLDQKLEPFYVQIRNDNPQSFQNEDNSWKPLAEVRQKVSELYIEPVAKAIKARYPQQEQLSSNRLASLRLYAMLEQAKGEIEKSFSNESNWLKSETASPEANKLAQAEPLSNQWKLEKKEMKLARNEQSSLPHYDELFALPSGSISKVFDAPNGDLYFFAVLGKGVDKENQENFQEQIARARFLLGSEAEQRLLYELLPQIKAKKAISFGYVNSEVESIEPEESPDV